MHQRWTFTVRRAGLSDTVAAQAERLIADLPAPAVVNDVGGIVWLVDVDDPRVADDVTQLLRTSGLHVTSGAKTVYDAHDRATADFVGIHGIDAESGLVRNGDVFSPDPPCPRCGHHDALDTVVNGPLRIDESVLGDAEIANLPNGQLLMTRDVVGRLERAGARGLLTDEMLVGRRRRPSRFVALRAPVSVLVPCPVHATVTGGEYCPQCGTAHGVLEGHFWLPRSAVGAVDVVSRHPHQVAMILVRRGILDAVGGVRGLRRADPAMVCPD